MTASCRYFQGALNALLAFHVAEINIEMVLLLVEFFTCVDDGRLVAVIAIHKADNVRQSLHAVDLQLVHDSRLADVLLWHDESLELLRPGSDGNGQCTSHGLQPPVEPQLTNEHIFVQSVTFYLVVGSQDGNGQRQIVARPLFFDVGR